MRGCGAQAVPTSPLVWVSFWSALYPLSPLWLRFLCSACFESLRETEVTKIFISHKCHENQNKQKCKEACSVCTVGNSSPSLPGECTRAGWSVLGWGARSKNCKIPDREGFAFLLVFISVFCKAYTSIFAFKYSLIFTCLKGYYNGLSKVSSPH